MSNSSEKPTTALVDKAPELPEAPTSVIAELAATLKYQKDLASIYASSDLVPKEYRGKPANCLIAFQFGEKLGLPPAQAIQGIAVINGRPSLWGDTLMALALADPSCKDIQEDEPTEENGMTATCIAQRHGRADVVRRFDMADAERAKLWGKPGPWTEYPKRMLTMRARNRAIRDQFADRLLGLSAAEELRDVIDVQVAEVAQPAALERPATRTAAVAGKLREARKRLITEEEVDVDTGEIVIGEIPAQGEIVAPPTEEERDAAYKRVMSGISKCRTEDDFRLWEAEVSEISGLDEDQTRKLEAQLSGTAKRLKIERSA